MKTAIAHPNIALIKYWGKRDITLNLPAVSSLSLTLSDFCTTTTVTAGGAIDSVTHNAAPAHPEFTRRTLLFLDMIDPNRPKCQISTKNNFPTKAGLASSSSGFAALALAASAELGKEATLSQLSGLARRGSGSASRSIFGGFVEWRCGTSDDGQDSIAHQIADEDHWPDLRMIVVVVSSAKKAVGSTEGMERSRQTSPLYQAWVDGADTDVNEGREAVMHRDIQRLGEVMESSTMKMHATMTSSKPPLLYWSGATVEVLHRIWDLRASGVAAWVTMDAGPNIKVLTTASHAQRIMDTVHDLSEAVHNLHAGGPAHLTAP